MCIVFFPTLCNQKLGPFQDVLNFGHGFRPKRAWWFSIDLLRRLLVSLLYIFITSVKLKVVRVFEMDICVLQVAFLLMLSIFM